MKKNILYIFFIVNILSFGADEKMEFKINKVQKDFITIKITNIKKEEVIEEKEKVEIKEEKDRKKEIDNIKETFKKHLEEKRKDLNKKIEDEVL